MVDEQRQQNANSDNIVYILFFKITVKHYDNNLALCITLSSFQNDSVFSKNKRLCVLSLGCDQENSDLIEDFKKL